MRISDWSSDVCSSDLPAIADALDGELPAGEQVDLLRRVLGLATEPPPCDPSTYWSIEWLSALAGAGREVVTLVDALALHPVTHLLERGIALDRSEEHTSELQSLMRISYAVFCLKKKTQRSKE